MAKQRFKITPYFNHTGSKAYRVYGRLNGKTIRKNFKTRVEAVTARDRLEIEYLNSKNYGQSIWTTLSHEENADAIRALGIIRESDLKKDLSFAARYLVEHYCEAKEQITANLAVVEYLQQREIDRDREHITKVQYRTLKGELNRFSAFFNERNLSEIQAAEIQAYLEGGDDKKMPSLKTWNNRRGYLSTFFKFCMTKKYAGENPILELPNYKLKKMRGTASTLSAQEAASLMHWLEGYRGNKRKDGSYLGEAGCLVPYFAITLFAGLRPDYKEGEMGKLQPSDIRYDTNVILVEPEVSKVNERRTIKMQPNLKAWLERYPLDKYPLIPKHMFTLITDVRKKFKLPHDVMRHTFISMTVGAFRSVGDASLQAGNSEAIIRKHYLDLKSSEEADAFWRIVPKGVELPELEKKDGWYVVKG
jgi:site-specific recombinase XerD